MYISLPVLGFLVWYYGWRLAGKSLALGFFAAAGLVAILFVVVDGADPPPGFGISGVPLGGCAVAYATLGSNPGLAEPRQVCYSHVLSLALDRGCTSLLLHFLLSGYGYRKNERLGHFLGRATAFATLTVGGGIMVSLKRHAACNPARSLQPATPRAQPATPCVPGKLQDPHRARLHGAPRAALERWAGDADLPGRRIRPVGHG